MTLFFFLIKHLSKEQKYKTGKEKKLTLSKFLIVTSMISVEEKLTKQKRKIHNEKKELNLAESMMRRSGSKKKGN